jgi:polyferredoxin
MIVYGVILLALIAGLTTSMATRTPIILDVIRDRNALYRELPNDVIENSYTLKVINQSDRPRTFELSVAGVEGISLDGVADTVTVDGGDVLSVPVRARAHRDNTYGIMTIQFIVTAVDDEDVALAEDSRFLGPTP